MNDKTVYDALNEFTEHERHIVLKVLELPTHASVWNFNLVKDTLSDDERKALYYICGECQDRKTIVDTLKAIWFTTGKERVRKKKGEKK